MHVEQCFFYEGEHYGPPECYHDMFPEPEEMQPGWTVQTRGRMHSYCNEDAASPER